MKTAARINPEVKFRAWCHISKKMSVPFDIFDYMDDQDRDYGVFDFPMPRCFFQGEATLIRFTGLHDKNGKEIYEGDIIAHDARKIYQPELWKSEVYFEGGCFRVKASRITHLDEEFHVGTSEKNLSNFTMDYIEVIGNIYENPELLKP